MRPCTVVLKGVCIDLFYFDNIAHRVFKPALYLGTCTIHCLMTQSIHFCSLYFFINFIKIVATCILWFNLLKQMAQKQNFWDVHCTQQAKTVVYTKNINVPFAMHISLLLTQTLDLSFSYRKKEMY